LLSLGCPTVEKSRCTVVTAGEGSDARPSALPPQGIGSLYATLKTILRLGCAALLLAKKFFWEDFVF
jgi:hypothetical protein